MERLYRIERNDVIYELHETEKGSNDYPYYTLYFKDSELNSIELHVIKVDDFKFRIDIVSSLGFTSDTLSY